MIGELFNAAVDEIVGNDPSTRQAAALPYIFAKYAAYTNIASNPAPAPAPTL